VDDPAGYALIDIGELRRLERFGTRLLDRPALGEGGSPRRDPSAWAGADARYERAEDGSGRWTSLRAGATTSWPVTVEGLTFELRLMASGGVGCYPEQAVNWRWIADRLTEIGGPLEVLNLFAHTGGATLAAARAGAGVVHVDAGRSAIAWARRNAELNGLADASIRWLVDDALAFTRREGRRGRRYRGVVLDPPSFGHGPGGRPWRLEDDLPTLLDACVAVLADGPGFVVLSTHTPGYGPDRLGTLIGDALHGLGAPTEVDELAVDATSGRRLSLGAVARWRR
jgi:23S rRNA (cytosine1962-C5)-methyltransferase